MSEPDDRTASARHPATAGLCCDPITAAVISESDAIELARVLKALADPVRLRLVSLVAASRAGEVCACEFPELVDRSQPTISHHLGQLTRAGILEREQRGKWAWFRLCPQRLDALCAVLAGLPDDCCPTIHSRFIDSSDPE